MKTRKKSHFGLSPGKFFVILLVVLASVYFIWQFMFIKNSQKSEAKDFNSQCCGRGTNNNPCPDGYICVVGSTQVCAYGVCQPETDMSIVSGAINLKCNCASEFGDCENKWGQINIKSRECAFSLNGTEICNYLTRRKLYQWVSCNN